MFLNYFIAALIAGFIALINYVIERTLIKLTAY